MGIAGTYCNKLVQDEPDRSYNLTYYMSVVWPGSGPDNEWNNPHAGRSAIGEWGHAHQATGPVIVAYYQHYQQAYAVQALLIVRRGKQQLLSREMTR